MACRGVHFSLDQTAVDRLLACASDDERLRYIQEQIEAEYFENHKDLFAETDKAWEWIHRAVTGGTYGWDKDPYPLSHLIMAGQSLYGRDGYVMSLKTQQQVVDVAAALATMTESTFRDGFAQIDPSDLEHSREEDLAYAWEWFSCLKEFWMKAASDQRFILFTVDQ
jgi:hypothetical protein